MRQLFYGDFGKLIRMTLDFAGAAVSRCQDTGIDIRANSY